MSHTWYVARYNALILRLKKLGVQYPAKVWWRLQPRQLDKYAITQLRAMSQTERTLKNEYVRIRHCEL